jgi:6-phosphofructokinase 1
MRRFTRTIGKINMDFSIGGYNGNVKEGNVKRIGVLTSGGDAPGMNAAIRAVVRTAIYHGFEVMGVERGYHGLLDNMMFPMNSRSVSEILQRGGTILKTARCEAFNSEEGIQRAVEVIKSRGIDSMVIIGGDGSFRGARDLDDAGIPTIAIPGTIDNDLGYTDLTIGFDTAITTVMESVSKLRDTSSSHERMFVVEVMGRNCGDIALFAGIISGAEEVIVPEMPFSVKEVAERVNIGVDGGKSHYIILVAEGAVDPYAFTEELEELTKINTRLAVIGHLQRGGSPTATDRLLATRMGARAVEELRIGNSGVAIGLKGNVLTTKSIDEALAVRDRLSMELYRLAEILAR